MGMQKVTVKHLGTGYIRLSGFIRSKEERELERRLAAQRRQWITGKGGSE